jgi:hypothetical protein
MISTIVETVLLATEPNWTLPLNRVGQASTFSVDPIFALVLATLLLTALILGIVTLARAFRGTDGH